MDPRSPSLAALTTLEPNTQDTAHMSQLRLLLIAGTLLVIHAPARAQVASALLHDGQPLVGAPAGPLQYGLLGIDTNTSGGFALRVNSYSTAGGINVSHAWGSADGTAPMVMLSETGVGVLTQNDFEWYLGIADSGAVGYGASGFGGPLGPFEGAFVDATPIAVTGDPYAGLPGHWWAAVDRVGVTAGGEPHFRASLAQAPGAFPYLHGLFYGSTPTALLLGGDVLPNLPEPLKKIYAVDYGYGISSQGTNFISRVTMIGPSVDTTNDTAMVVGGSGLMLGGSLVQEDVLVPMSVGGDGVEKWDGFYDTGINEHGDYFFTGNNTGNPATDTVLVHNGRIRFREGDSIDGHVVAGGIFHADMHESGRVAYIWDVLDSGGVERSAIFFEDELLVMAGDPVDWDGDGQVDAGVTLSQINDLAVGSLGNDYAVYFTAYRETIGISSGFFRVVIPNPVRSFCAGNGAGASCPCGNFGSHDEGCVNSSGSGALLTDLGNAEVAADTLELRASGAPANTPGLFFQGDSSLGLGNPFGDGLLCAGGQIQRLEIAFTDAAGRATMSSSVSAAGGVGAGDLRFYQYWYRDVLGPCGSGFNTTNALAVQW